MKNVFDDKCIDSKDTQIGTKTILYGCHNLAGNQFIAFAKDGSMITNNENRCIGVSKHENNSTISVALVAVCSETDTSQRWQYNFEVRMPIYFFTSSKSLNCHTL